VGKVLGTAVIVGGVMLKSGGLTGRSADARTTPGRVGSGRTKRGLIRERTAD
jgi:hypothetical protein